LKIWGTTDNMEEENKTFKLGIGLYEETKRIVEANPISFSTTDSFIEDAVRNYIASIKYNIEMGVNSVISQNTGALRRSQKIFTICLACEKAFLKDRNSLKESSRICSNCRSNIIFFSKLLEKEDPEFREMKERFTIE